MSTTAVLRSEWIKIRSVRSVWGSLTAVFVATLVVTVLTFATVGQAEAGDADLDPVFEAFYALNFGQIAAISFGATALSSEFLNGALRISLSAVPRRGLFYAAKMSVVGGLALGVGLVTSFTTFFVGRLFVAGSVAQYLPDRARQLILHQNPGDGLGPWTGLAVTAAAPPPLAGWWAVRGRDA